MFSAVHRQSSEENVKHVIVKYTTYIVLSLFIDLCRWLLQNLCRMPDLHEFHQKDTSPISSSVKKPFSLAARRDELTE